MKIVKKYIVPIIAGLALVAIVAAVLVIGPSEEKKKTASKEPAGVCGTYRHDATVKVSGQTFDVELPKNPDAFAKGLGGRPCITASQGMLFRFTKPGQYPFWMKGMKFPIDIIWIGADHKVAAEEVNESPSTYPDKFVNQKPAQYVLEVKANTTKRLNIDIGTPVTF